MFVKEPSGEYHHRPGIEQKGIEDLLYLLGSRIMAVTDVDIQRWVEQRYGFVPHPYWIAHCKELYRLAVECSEDPRKPWHQCPPEKRSIFKEAFDHFGLVLDERLALS